MELIDALNQSKIQVEELKSLKESKENVTGTVGIEKFFACIHL